MKNGLLAMLVLALLICVGQNTFILSFSILAILVIISNGDRSPCKEELLILWHDELSCCHSFHLELESGSFPFCVMTVCVVDGNGGHKGSYT